MRASLSIGLLAICLALMGSSAPAASAASMVAERSVITGVVKGMSGNPLARALVVLQCTCLGATRETQTDANGIYRFERLPPGRYTIQVLVGMADVSKVIEIRSRGASTRSNFSVDPTSSERRVVVVKAAAVREETSGGRAVTMEEFRNIPVGGTTSRDFTQVVESSAGGGPVLVQEEPWNREGYAHLDEGNFLSVADRPLSTFSADVDTASYANVRRFIADGGMPPPDAVRIEELVNYFDYDYVEPEGNKAIAVNWELGECPWNREHLLARIGLQTREIDHSDVPPRNLVFLLDVSGSMAAPNKLPLLQRAMALLVDGLRAEDRVSIVVYAGAAGLVLPPTAGNERTRIRNAIADLEPGGSTNGAGGIRLAYDLAKKAFLRKGINRVILATDGDFNVGTTSDGDLTRLIEQKRRTGVFLSVLGFGTGNLQDAKMELLADKGNGNYAYIDTLHEARKVLVEEAGATLVTVAKDVKLQVELNPDKVAEYRLIGYENRRLADEDFDDDRKDAGEMGAGHSVTALYELVPLTEGSAPRGSRKLRYQGPRQASKNAGLDDEWMMVSVRYKTPNAQRSRLLQVPMRGTPKPLKTTSDDFRFAAGVSTFGMVLRGSEHVNGARLADARDLISDALGRDPHGHKAAFVSLVNAAIRLEDGRRGASLSPSSP